MEVTEEREGPGGHWAEGRCVDLSPSSPPTPFVSSDRADGSRVVTVAIPYVYLRAVLVRFWT